MVNRMVRLTKSSSFFLFGPRGSGKSTLIKHRYCGPHVLYIDLLDPQIEDRYRIHPSSLKEQVQAQKSLKWVIIDEVQKLPRLLDVVHQLIENRKMKFILSGSSARKLKRGGANLLAGRAFVYHLYPLASWEIGHRWTLRQILQWGTLPRLLSLKSSADRLEYLRAYVFTYIKEEILVEQIIRKLDPFRKFLEVAAQMNGKIINYSRIGREVGVDTTTVQNYYTILEDTLLGFFLPPYHVSVRKSQKLSPKFYLFDTGVCRVLNNTLEVPLAPGTYEFGNVFEHFIMLECVRLAEYLRKNWRFSYLMTKEGAEIDLIITRPGQSTVCMEIKSTSCVTKEDISPLSRLGGGIRGAKLYCLSEDPQHKEIQGVCCLPWQEGLKKIFKP